MVLVALAVCVSSGRPVLFGHERRGLDGRPFRVLKFRTMGPDPGGGLPITGKGDSRVTSLGRVLRAIKIDELPQLINVLRGEMSIVGPRPEVPEYVAGYTADQRRVLRVRPGLTDPASVAFRDEEILLGSVDPGRREAFYLSEILKTFVVIVLPSKA
jgi:lipopolysaccharide/colanic/teichoic acid biosynthesis glycosyltransferase